MMTIPPKMADQEIYIVVGADAFAFWIDRKMGKLIELVIGKERTTIITENEFASLRKTSKRPFIVIGGPDANKVATEICEMHPIPMYVHHKGKKELFFIHGGVAKNDGEYG